MSERERIFALITPKARHPTLTDALRTRGNLKTSADEFDGKMKTRGTEKITRYGKNLRGTEKIYAERKKHGNVEKMS